MVIFSDTELGRLQEAAALILQAEARLPVLGAIVWDRQLADDFLSGGCKVPPRPVYRPIDPQPSRDAIEAARALINGSSPVHDWLRRLADTFSQTADMMASVGTADFHKYSVALYGSPNTAIDGREFAVLALANRLDELLSDFELGCSRLGPAEVLTADHLKRRLDRQLADYFGEFAPEVLVTNKVSGKAAAGRNYIKVREDAVFSDLDVQQLLQHEALIHIATNFNGQAQKRFAVLGESHPGNTRTQEGLAVFAEFISGGLDPARLQRLANRVIAIDMAEQGADFIELFNFFQERNTADAPFEAFESARRVVRGGVIDGGAPFTKDTVYLGGLLEVHNYLRSAVKTGDAAFIRLLFVGKIDLADLEAMKMLRAADLIDEPRWVPPWVSDLRRLLSYLAYSTFLNEIDLGRAGAKYNNLFNDE